MRSDLGVRDLFALGGNPLRPVEFLVAAQYRLIAHAEPVELATRLAEVGREVVLFDVRAADEFAVSRIPEAIHLDPSIDGREFHRRYGERIRNRDVIVYCSVGLRSSRVAERLKSALSVAGPRSVANLRGGIFRWSNEGRPLVGPDGATRLVHPLNAFWSLFLLP